MDKWVPRGLEKATLDEYEKYGRNGRDLGYYRCLASLHNTYPLSWIPKFGEEYRCRKIRGHSGDHKWYDSDKEGDYDLWFGTRKYDYQLEEF